MAKHTSILPAAVARTNIKANKAHQLDDSSNGVSPGLLLLKIFWYMNVLSVIILQCHALTSSYIYILWRFEILTYELLSKSS